MSAAPINYDALAQQHGGAPASVDYDALAAHHGAVGDVAAPSEQKGFFSSFADSSGLTGAVHALAHPIDTITGIPAAVASAAKAIPDEIHQEVNAVRENGLTPDTRRLIASHVPIAGPVLKEAQAQHDAGNDAGMAGTLAGTVGAFVGPQAVMEAAKGVVPLAGKAVLLGKTPEGAYESAMKPSPAISAADRTAMVQTGLENAIPVSKGGVQKLGDLIEDLNQKIKGEIASDPNRPIDPNKVATRADAAKARFATQVNAQPDLNAIEASRQQFLDEQGRTPAVAPKPTGLVDAQGKPIMTQGTPAQPAPDMAAADAQAMKQGTYRVLKGKFGEQGSASVEAQKALARGLKEEIASQFPEIGQMNAAESRLLDLQPVLERAVNRISNHQAIGIGTPVAGVAAEAMTGSTGVGRVAMVLKGVLDNPSVKSRLAIAVSKSQKIPISQAISKVNAYASSLGSAALASQANSSDDNPSQPATQPVSPQ